MQAVVLIAWAHGRVRPVLKFGNEVRRNWSSEELSLLALNGHLWDPGELSVKEFARFSIDHSASGVFRKEGLERRPCCYETLSSVSNPRRESSLERSQSCLDRLGLMVRIGEMYYESPSDRQIRDGLAAAGPGIIALVVLMCILVGLLVASVAAIIGAFVVVALTRCIGSWDAAPTYGEAYRASFCGILAYVVLSFGAEMLLGHFREGWIGLGLLIFNRRMQVLVYEHPSLLCSIAGSALLAHGPGLLACTWILRQKLRDSFEGFVGFVWALVVSVFCLVISGAAVVWTGWIFLLRSEGVSLNLDGIVKAVVALAGVIFVYGIVGALCGSIILWLSTRLLVHRRRVSYPQIYLTTVLALMAWLTMTGWLEFLLPDGDPIFGWIDRIAASERPLQFVWENPDLLASQTQIFLLLQIPVLIIVAAVIVGRLDGVYRGRLGYLKALVAASISSAASLASVIALAIGIWHSGVLAQVLR
jgi:hypothetical protein